MRAFVVKGRPIVTSSNKNLKSWRQEVAGAAAMALPNTEPWQGPIYAHVTFYFDRPKSVKSECKTTRPDLDKLLRGILDALTGIIFNDDAQVIYCGVEKHYGSPARAEISVKEVTHDEYSTYRP